MSHKYPYRTETRQGALFDDPASNGPTPFVGCDGRLREALSAAIKGCSRGDRAWLAAELTRLLDVDVCRSTIDSWTALSREDHRVPASYLPAICIALGDMRPLRLLAEIAGCQLVEPGEEGLLAWAKAEKAAAEADAKAKRLRSGLIGYRIDQVGRR